MNVAMRANGLDTIECDSCKKRAQLDSRGTEPPHWYGLIDCRYIDDTGTPRDEDFVDFCSRSLSERRQDPNNQMTGYRHLKGRVKAHPEAQVGRAIVDVPDADFGETSYMVEVVRIPNESVWSFVEFHDALGEGHQVALPGPVTKKIDDLIRTTGKRSSRAAARRNAAPRGE